jgi:integrase
MRGCGLRIQEALAVQTSCFRDGGRTLRVYEQARRDGHGTMALKHRRPGQHRDIPVPGYLRAMVQDLPDGYLFRTNDVFARYNGYFDMFKRLARKAGIPGDSPRTASGTRSSRLSWPAASRSPTSPSGSGTKTSTSPMPSTGTWYRTPLTGP